MRIRRSASRLLGATAASSSCTEPHRFEPPRCELPRFEPPPPPAPADEPRAGFLGPEISSCGEPFCKLSQSPWDLMAQLDLSDPQVEGLFVETCFVSVAWRPSWLFSPNITIPMGSIKEEEEEDMPTDMVDMVDGVCLKLHKAAKKAESKNNGTKLKTNKGIKMKKGVPMCKKNDGKKWCCRQPVTEPNSYCSYHSDLKFPISEKPRRKRPTVDVDEGFYYYAGFGPGTKRRRTSSKNSVLEPPLPAEPLKKEAPSEMQLDFSAGQVQATESDHQVVLPPSAHIIGEPTRNDGTAGITGCNEESSDDDVPEPALPAEAPKEESLKEEAQSELQVAPKEEAQADDSNNKAAPASVLVVDEPKRNDGAAGIAGCDEESSDDEWLGCSGEQPRDITKRKSPLKKRWRKPVKARSLKSLMA